MVGSSPASGATQYRTDVVGSRAVAQVVDWFAIFVVTFGVGIAFLLGLDGSLSQSGVTILAVLCSFLYNATLEGVCNGQTVGKRLVGIRVQGERGSDVSFVQALIRNIPAIFSPGLFLYLVALLSIAMDDKKRRVFDHAASTIVVRAPA